MGHRGAGLVPAPPAWNLGPIGLRGSWSSVSVLAGRADTTSLGGRWAGLRSRRMPIEAPLSFFPATCVSYLRTAYYEKCSWFHPWTSEELSAILE